MVARSAARIGSILIVALAWQIETLDAIAAEGALAASGGRGWVQSAVAHRFGRRHIQRSQTMVINDPRNAGAVMVIDVEHVRELASRGFDQLLMQELTEVIASAEDAAREARAAQETARLRAEEADETATEARRLAPGFPAHFPDRDAVWAYVTFRRPDGSEYAGKWRAFRDLGGYREHGLGVLASGEGLAYRGEFREGRPGGAGVLATGRRLYEGMLSEGRPSGYGVERRTGRREFAGQFAAGLAEGAGVLEQPSYSYIGQFAAGRRNGLGRVRYADGRIEQGLWHDDQLVYAFFRPRARRSPPRGLEPPEIGDAGELAGNDQVAGD